MPLNFHVPLPGPFSYSARVTPSISRTLHQVGRAARQLPDRESCSRCTRPRAASRPARRPEVPQYYRPVRPSAIPPTPRYANILWVLLAMNLLLLMGAFLLMR